MPLDQDTTPYLSALQEHADRKTLRLNVPSHKGGRHGGRRLDGWVGEQLLALDIPPLIRGVDMGGSPTPFEQAQRLAAAAWGAERTWFGVNGASGVVQAVLLTLAQMPGGLLMQRNVHGSAIDGLVLSGLRPRFLEPQVDPDLGMAHAVTRQTIERELALAPDVRAVFVVSPNYYGTAADVPAISEVVHAAGALLVVDESWGSHLRFHEAYPPDALGCGADLVISSTHKMAGSLGQSAMLHLGPTGRVAVDAVERAMTMLESTSPSALLSGSLDAARHHMVTDGHAALDRTLSARASIDESIRDVGLEVLDERWIGRYGITAVDPLKLCIDVRATGLTGREIKAFLFDEGIDLELGEGNVVLAVLAPGEDIEDLRPLLNALQRRPRGAVPSPAGHAPQPPSRPAVALAAGLSAREAFLADHERVPLEAAHGRVAAESLAVYPPGIPNIVLGEFYGDAVIEVLQAARDSHAIVRGSTDRSLRTVLVVR